MDVFDYALIAFFAISSLLVLIFALKTGKFFKTLLCSAAAGVITLLIMYFCAPLTGFRLELTGCTVTGSAVFGLPGVLGMTIIKMLL